eukprot:355137-Chlamydomonas_euryale.AAC.3
MFSPQPHTRPHLVEGLHADAEAVHTQRQVLCQPGGIKCAGVCLKRDLGQRRHTKALAQRTQDSADEERRHQGRCLWCGSRGCDRSKKREVEGWEDKLFSSAGGRGVEAGDRIRVPFVLGYHMPYVIQVCRVVAAVV